MTQPANHVAAGAAAGYDGVGISDLGWLRMLSRIVEQVGDGVSVFNADGYLIYANPAFAAFHRVDRDALTGTHIGAFGESGMTPHELVDAVQQAGVLRMEVGVSRLDGSPADALLTMSALLDGDGSPVGQIICVQDITERRALQDDLRRAAMHDPLTGLPNRRLLRDRLGEAIATAETHDSRLAVIFIDLDGFKPINDLYGHHVGDQLLTAVSERLKSCTRPSDTVARLGGDEFVVLLPDVKDPHEAIATARRVLAAIETQFDLADASVTVTASIGIATSGLVEPRTLMHEADTAMYAAKASGGGTIVAATEPDHQARTNRPGA